MRLPNLHTAPMGDLIKIGTFLNKGRFLWHKPTVWVTF